MSIFGKDEEEDQSPESLDCFDKQHSSINPKNVICNFFGPDNHEILLLGD